MGRRGRGSSAYVLKCLCEAVDLLDMEIHSTGIVCGGRSIFNARAILQEGTR